MAEEAQYWSDYFMENPPRQIRQNPAFLRGVRQTVFKVIALYSAVEKHFLHD